MHWPVISWCASASSCGLSAILLYVSTTLEPKLKLHQLLKSCSSHGSEQEHKRANQNYISTLKVSAQMEHVLRLLTSIGQSKPHGQALNQQDKEAYP